MPTATNSDTGSSVARGVVLAGWFAKGVVYVALAWLVLQIALGTASQQASTTGALQYIAQTAPGRLAIVALGVGLLAYAVGRILEVTVLARGNIDAKDKVLGAVLAVVYLSLAASAFAVLGLAGSAGSAGGGGGGGGGGSTEQKGSTLLLGLPGGRYIVGAIGVAAILVGLYSAYQGVQKAFLETLRTGEMSSSVRSAARWIGTAAYVTKGAIFVLLGWFFLQSAITYDPQKARGLDGALREIAGTSWGQVVLVLIAVGLLAYALFAMLEAKYRKVGVSALGTTT